MIARAFPRPLRVALFFLGATGAVSVWASELPPTAAAAQESPAQSDEDPGDLGTGLRFIQFTGNAVDDKTLGLAEQSAALVIDLRLAPADATTRTAIERLLAGRTPLRPAFVLVGAGTPDELRALGAGHPGIVTLAAKSLDTSVTLSIDIPPAQDLVAARAIAAGAVPADLSATRIEKARFDEARLVRNHANGVRAIERSQAGENTDAKEPEEAVPQQDVLLQRAVFLHRALLALGRIPAHT